MPNHRARETASDKHYRVASFGKHLCFLLSNFKLSTFFTHRPRVSNALAALHAHVCSTAYSYAISYAKSLSKLHLVFRMYYVSRNLGICAILRLHCAFSESGGCVPISRLCTRDNYAISRLCGTSVLMQFLLRSQVVVRVSIAVGKECT